MLKLLTKFLSIPLLYDTFQYAVGGKKAYKIYVTQYLQPKSRMRILDVGCGTGEILKYLPKDVFYKGYDISSSYIDSARQNFGNRGDFAIGNAANIVEPEESFDLVMVNGALHHMDDATVLALLAKINPILKSGGRFISLDGVYTDNQSRIARLLLDADRGKHVRTKEQYMQLAKKYFEHIDANISNHLLRIPYTHLIMIGYKT
ncbi:MAG: class I SAM-dependent methyltransferase [Chryseobacterium sp.]